jgi:hypothetical protein
MRIADFFVFRGVSRRLWQGSGKWQKAAKKPLRSGFVKKTSQNFWRELKKWSAFFYLPRHSETSIETTNSELCCEIKF